LDGHYTYSNIDNQATKDKLNGEKKPLKKKDAQCAAKKYKKRILGQATGTENALRADFMKTCCLNEGVKANNFIYNI